MKRCDKCAGRLEVIDGMRPTGHHPDCAYERGAKSEEEIKAIVENIKFRDRTFRLLKKGDGFLLQLQYFEPDINAPEGPPVLQSARKWYVSPWMTETEIVETAFAACRRSMDHVLKEHFKYKGERVYSPHFDVNARLEMCQKERFDRREDRR